MIDVRRTLKAALPAEYTEIAKHRYRATLRPWLTRRYSGDARFCPICESHVARFLPADFVPQPDARCPICGSLDRQRLFWLYLTERTDLFSERTKQLLHIAPEYAIAQRLKSVPTIEYLSADLNSRMVMVRMDITDIQFPKNVFDVILCNHVMEHIPDDAAALAELYRVLKPGGWAILQTPIKGVTTIEDPSVTTPRERLERFGQRDHVRIYGRDYVDRLAAAGFEVTVDGFGRTIDDERATLMGLDRSEDIYVCVKPA
jgi:hypothetical protein